MVEPVDAATTPEPSFHSGGELLAQEKAGTREDVEAYGSKVVVVRRWMPNEDREFFSKLSFVVVGVDQGDDGVWASIVTGPEGFLSSPDPHTLTWEKRDPGPLDFSRPGTRLGLLGIQFDTRRRSRVNAKTVSESSLSVELSFGNNCPQYIQQRSVERVVARDYSEDIVGITKLLGETEKALIERADTFFVASTGGSAADALGGVDVSHCGGRPGFVEVLDDRTLLVPDMVQHTQLGNFLPRAGLVFLDKSKMLMLTGNVVEILCEPPACFADRASWRFEVGRGIWANTSLLFGEKEAVFSSTSLLTGTWEETACGAEAKRQAIRPFRVFVDDASYLIPVDGDPVLPFEPGQKVTICDRGYYLASGPSEPYYRVLAPLPEDEVVHLAAPDGDAFFDAAAPRPAVLLCSGAGLAPVLSILHHAVREGNRMRGARKVTVIAAGIPPVFKDEIASLKPYTPDLLTAVFLKTAKEMTKSQLQAVLPIDDYDFFLAPGNDLDFKAAADDLLITAFNIRDARIFRFPPLSSSDENDDDDEKGETTDDDDDDDGG